MRGKVALFGFQSLQPGPDLMQYVIQPRLVNHFLGPRQGFV
jgi:hypothetical protein